MLVFFFSPFQSVFQKGINANMALFHDSNSGKMPIWRYFAEIQAFVD